LPKEATEANCQFYVSVISGKADMKVEGVWVRDGLTRREWFQIPRHCRLTMNRWGSVTESTYRETETMKELVFMGRLCMFETSQNGVQLNNEMM
jgi:hypothetical protein